MTCGGFSFYFYLESDCPLWAIRRLELFYYVDRNYLSYVGVLYVDVNWHGVLPLPFLFLFFHCRPELAAPGARIVNVVNVSGYWLLGKWLQLRF